MKKHFSEVISFLLIIFLLIISLVSVVAAVQDSTAIPIAYVLTDGTYNYRIQYDQLLTSYISYRSNTEASAARLAKFYFDTLNNDISGLVAYQSGNTQKYVGYADILSKYVSTRNINTTYTWFNGDSSTAAFSDWTEVKIVGSDGVISGRVFVGSDGLAGVVKTELNTAISSANSNISSTAVSTDGSDVNTTDMWVRQPVKAAYLDAISAAQAVADNPGVTQQQADDALAAINNATNTFNAAKTSGTNIPVIEITVTGESTVQIGLTLQLEAVITPSNATRQAISWTVNPGTGTSTISTAGLLTATGIGTVTAIATNAASGVTGTKVITIISELDAAKAAAHDALTAELATYTESDYSAENWTILTGFKTAGDSAIDAATNLAGVTSAKDTAIAGMADVETIAETLAAAKETAHDALTAALETYTESDYTADNWTTLTGFKTDGDTAIDAATDLAGVDSAKKTAIDGMAGVETIAGTLAAAKVTARGDLTTALATYTQTDYSTDNWTALTGFKTAGDTAINAATDLDGVDSAKKTAIDGMAAVETIAGTLAAAKVTARGDLTTALATYSESDYTADNWTTLTGFKTAGDTAIGTAMNLEGVASAKKTAIDGMDGVLTIDEVLIAAKAAEAALNPDSYIDYSAVTAALAMPETTNDEKSAKANAINTAIAALELKREITGYTPLTTIVIDTDRALVNLAQLKLNGDLPKSVLVTDGIHPSVSATITDWTGTFDGQTIGTKELTAVWTVPEGYVDATPTIITILIDLQVIQTNQVISIEAKTPPIKTIYYIGEQLDMTGMAVTLNYADSSNLDVDFEDFSTYGITTDLAQGAALGSDVIEITIMANGNTAYQSIYVGGLERPTVLESVAATSVQAGETLDSSILSGSFQDSSLLLVDGTLTWEAPLTVVGASGSFSWIFTPADPAKYTPVVGTAAVTVVP